MRSSPVVFAAVLAALLWSDTASAQDATAILKAHADLLSAQSRAYAEFVTNIGLAAAAILAFFGVKTWWDIKSTVDKAVAKVREDAEKKASEHMAETLEELRKAAETRAAAEIERQTNALAAQYDQLAREVTEERDRIAAELQALRESLAMTAEDVLRRAVRPRAQGSDAVPKRILWVDDDPANNAYEAEVLRQAGGDVVQVTSTELALEALQRGGHYDLVISDMARGDNARAGLDLLERLRANGGTLPFVFFASRGAAERHGAVADRLDAVMTSERRELFRALRSRIGMPEE